MTSDDLGGLQFVADLCAEYDGQPTRLYVDLADYYEVTNHVTDGFDKIEFGERTKTKVMGMEVCLSREIDDPVVVDPNDYTTTTDWKKVLSR